MDPDRLPAPDVAPERPAVVVQERGWHRLVAALPHRAQRAAMAAGGAGAIVFSSDCEVRRLNARFRGRNKPTNVLTFEDGAGDIILALGTIRREARAAGRPVSHHLLHLIVHGALHLRGHDHHAAGEARRMEMEEARILRRLGVPNPWKPKQANAFGSAVSAGAAIGAQLCLPEVS